ncbi:hypothetical protein QO004_006084 [Rhizobium mesoamericanum]|nr:hypothetical protein [Rhizobium mesoamericanum]
MMMKAAPAASLVVAEPEFLLEFLIIALDAPAVLTSVSSEAAAASVES